MTDQGQTSIKRATINTPRQPALTRTTMMPYLIIWTRVNTVVSLTLEVAAASGMPLSLYQVSSEDRVLYPQLTQENHAEWQEDALQARATMMLITQ
jgi:hypothetical protein